MYKAIIAYFLIINLIGCIINISDKSRAKRDKWRIKESTLWTVGLLGGAPLSYITMLAIRHKTKHLSFMLIMPILTVADIVLLIYLLNLTLPK